MTKLHWGLLSTANINRQLIPPIRASARGELTAVASRDAAKSAEYAKTWDIPKAFDSYESMLAAPDVDVVYIGLPNNMHAEWAIKSMEAGKHVLLEKPFALNLAEVDQVIETSKRTGKVVIEAFMYRYSPQLLKIKEVIESGALGEINAVKASFTFYLDEEVNVRLMPETGGGSLWDVGCYPVSICQYVMGDKPIEVFGRQQTNAAGVDLTFLGQMRYANGKLGQFDCGFRTPYRTYVEVLGTKGSLSTRPFRPDANYTGEATLHINRGDREEIISVPNPPLYIGEVEDMHDAILEGKAQRVTLAETRNHIATICALYDSAKSGQPVVL
jgi:D-xylose 1-dehydrogenase (NADP+, D-xylono-1,5-lactone-forming)